MPYLGFIETIHLVITFSILLISPNSNPEKIKFHQLPLTFKHITTKEKIEHQKQLSGANTSTSKLESALEKITFDLSTISPEGLIGSGDGLRSLSYEFCIPKNAQYVAEVQKIDPEINLSNSRGRIGCTANQYLCIGETHQKNWYEILISIAQLDYVQRIDQFFGE